MEKKKLIKYIVIGASVLLVVTGIVVGSTFWLSKVGADKNIEKKAVSVDILEHQYEPSELVVMSYNIRLKKGDKLGKRRWGIRFPLLLDNIRSIMPDIIGMQEVQPDQEIDLDKYLFEYDKVLLYRSDDESTKEAMVIYYRPDRFELHENANYSGGFWLSETPNTQSKGWDAAFERVCAYVTLVEKGTGFVFTVFNTHLDHRGEVAREESIKLISQKIEEFNAENVILMGDFNFKETDDNYTFATQYFFNAKYYPSDVVRISEGRTYNGYRYEPSETTEAIDHVFYFGSLQALTYEVVTTTPNGIYPSDHFPVVVNFKK